MMIPENLVYEFETNESWLRHKSDLHGIAHMTRVFILQELICELLEANGTVVNREAVRFAAMAHDLGRENDGTDPEHSRRSADWMKRNLAGRTSPEVMGLATFAVHWHVPPDDAAPIMTAELMALKDADGLDRVRLGDLDPAFLRTDAAKSLVEVAERLYRFSLMYSQRGMAACPSVVKAAKELGLVY